MTKRSVTSQEQINFEIQFYEGVIKNAPDFIEALMALGDLYTKAGLYAKGLGVDQKLARLRPKDPLVQYNLACSFALLNHNELALSAIRRAIDFGYDDFDHLEADSDLANLLNDKQFLEFLRGIKRKKKTRSVQQTT